MSVINPPIELLFETEKVEMTEKPKKAYLVQKIDKHGYEYICGIALSSETAQNFVNEKNEESRTKKTGKHFWYQNLNIIE